MVDLPSEPVHTRLLLRLLGSTTTDNLDWPEPANWDWRQFAAACDHHHVAPFIYCRLKELGNLRVPTRCSSGCGRASTTCRPVTTGWRTSWPS